MKIDYHSQILMVKFFYDKDIASVPNTEQRNRGLLPTKGATTCTISKVLSDTESEVLMSATCYCSKKDIFDRAKGRKLALTRALGKMPREIRKLVWKQYFIEHKK